MFQSGISGFAGESLTFQTNRQVMLYSYAWRLQQLAQFTDLRWTAAPIPTLTGDFHQNMARMQYYFGLSVPRSNPEEEVRAAFEFIAWAYGDDDRLMDLNSRSGTLPTKMSLWTYPEIVENPVLFTLTQTLPLSTVPGETPQWLLDALIKCATPSGTARAIPASSSATWRQINARLKEEPLSWVAE